MNLKSLFLVGGLVSVIGVSSFNQPFKNANAALTAPATWTFKYTNQDAPGFKLRNSTTVISTPNYTRTADGVYYNYTSTFTITTGLTATQTFNRSNSTWYDAGSGNYIPSAAAIGSDNTVGSIRKTYLKFDNQTEKDYLLYFDFSSSSNQGHYYEVSYNSTDISNAYINGFLLAASATNFTILYIPSYTNFEIYGRENTISNYLDSWYLKDLGVSGAYEAGVDDGIIQGEQNADSTVLLDAVETVVGVAINFILMIMTFSIFDISLLNIALVLVAVLGIIWILKALRG